MLPMTRWGMSLIVGYVKVLIVEEGDDLAQGICGENILDGAKHLLER